MNIGFYFDYNGTVLRVPVNPEVISVSAEGKNETLEVVNFGEVNMLKNAGLRQISFESFFPSHADHPAVMTKGQFLQPKEYLDFFSRVRNDRQPLYFILTGDAFENQIHMSIENFEWSQEAMDDDVLYSIELKEFKPVVVKTTEIPLSAVREVPPMSTSSSSGRSSGSVVIGSTVIVNGTLHKDSYGNGPGLTEVNAKRKVSNVKEGRTCPYHVTLMDGGWRGWVTADSVVLA